MFSSFYDNTYLSKYVELFEYLNMDVSHYSWDFCPTGPLEALKRPPFIS